MNEERLTGRQPIAVVYDPAATPLTRSTVSVCSLYAAVTAAAGLRSGRPPLSRPSVRRAAPAVSELPQPPTLGPQLPATDRSQHRPTPDTSGRQPPSTRDTEQAQSPGHPPRTREAPRSNRAPARAPSRPSSSSSCPPAPRRPSPRPGLCSTDTQVPGLVGGSESDRSSGS